MLMALGIVTLPVTFSYRFLIVDREKRFLSTAFAHYIDPIVVKKIGERAKDIKLGGESRELSILFSDIAGFTTISEKLPVTDLFLLMSSYLSRMTNILIAQ
jgi:adenylate cyclase